MSILVSMMATAPVVLGAWAWFEAGWLRRRVLELAIPGLPATLDGIRIGHLSDFHLGAPLSRGNRASEHAARWVASRTPDLVCVTGDLVSRPRGERRLRRIVEALGRPYVVLGNHDIAVTRDPFSRSAELRDLESAVLLRDEAVTVRLRGEDVSIVGVDPETYRAKTARPQELADTGAQLRVLLCHFPGIVRTIPAGSFDLVLAGHLHAGQICAPLPSRRITLAHPRARFVAGPYATPAGLMHVSPGTGTTFVPFRFFARPEVTELILRRVPEAA